MAKKKREELEELEDEDLDEEEYDEEDEEYDEDEDEEEYDEEDEDLDEEEGDSEEEDYDEEHFEDDTALVAGGVEEKDPYWWTPHLVLGLLLLVSLLGFFGFFNPWLGHLAPSPEEHRVDMNEAPAAAPTAQPTPPPARTVQIPPRDVAQEIYGARHILVQHKGARKAADSVTRSKEEAKKIADTVAAEAKKTKDAENRADAWKAIAVKHDDPNAERTGGDLGLFRPGAYDADFVEAVKGMKVGDVSDPVETPFGYHIIWRTK